MQDKLRHVAFSGMLYFLLVVRFCIAGLFLIGTIYFIAMEKTTRETKEHFMGDIGVAGDFLDFTPLVIGLGISVLDFIAIIGLFRWKMWGLQLHVAITVLCIFACPLFAIELALFIGSMFVGNKYTKAWPQLEI